MRRLVSTAVVLLCGCDRLALPPPPPPPPPPPTVTCSSPATSPTPLRRLTRAEYDATVRDLLGDATRPARAFPPDEESQGFDNFADTQTVSPLLAERLLSAAEALAAAVDVTALAGCSPTEAGCLQKLLDGFARRAYRRPLTAEERTRLTTVFDQLKSAEDADAAMRGVVAVVLQSPQFLYRYEADAKLTPPELAARLAHFLWGSAPDDALLAAAQAGPFDVGAQAQRMLADPRAKDVVRRFHLQWLGVAHLGALTKEAPGYAALAPLFEEETARTAEWAVFDGNGDVRRLFTGYTSFFNEPLATHYGFTGFTGPSFVKADTDRTARIGVLTQGSVLAAWSKHDQTSPVLRGKLVRERFLCQPPKPPPGNVVAMIGTPDAGTTRARFAAHAVPECSGCHQLLDPIGFGLERYDAVGVYRVEENGVKVDARGEVLAGGDLDGTFDGALELSARLAASRDVKRCYARQWFRFAFGRAETPADACSLEAVQKAFEQSGWNTRALLVALTQTEAFARNGR